MLIKKGAPKIIISLFLFVISFYSMDINGEETSQNTQNSQKEIEEYLKKAQEFNTKTVRDFSATQITSNMGGTPTIAKYYQKNNNDGSVVTRSESKYDDDKIIIIQNNSGTWSIQDNKALRFDYLKTMKKNAAQEIFNRKNNVSNKRTISLSKKEYEINDNYYYVVSMKTELSEDAKKEQLDLVDKIMPKELKANLKSREIAAFIPFMQEFYFGKQDMFLYKKVSYNINGKILNKTEYKEVKINLGLKDDLFEIPKSMKIVEVKNILKQD